MWFRWVTIVQSSVFSVNYVRYFKNKNSWATGKKTIIACLTALPWWGVLVTNLVVAPQRCIGPSKASFRNRPFPSKQARNLSSKMHYGLRLLRWNWTLHCVDHHSGVLLHCSPTIHYHQEEENQFQASTTNMWPVLDLVLLHEKNLWKRRFFWGSTKNLPLIPSPYKKTRWPFTTVFTLSARKLFPKSCGTRQRESYSLRWIYIHAMSILR